MVWFLGKGDSVVFEDCDGGSWSGGGEGVI